MFRPMPTIQVESLPGEAYLFAQAIIANQGKNKGRLRTAKSKNFTDEEYYVWRMVSFYASPDPKASCMPIGAMYTLPNTSQYTGHKTTCPKDARSYPSYDIAYARGTGMYDEQGNYRVACDCGRDEYAKEQGAKEQKRKAELESIIGLILNTIPQNEWYGARRWKKAFTGNDPYDNGGILDNVSAYVTKEQELEGAMM